jgi:hypothetical protein
MVDPEPVVQGFLLPRWWTSMSWTGTACLLVTSRRRPKEPWVHQDEYYVLPPTWRASIIVSSSDILIRNIENTMYVRSISGKHKTWFRLVQAIQSVKIIHLVWLYWLRVYRLLFPIPSMEIGLDYLQYGEPTYRFDKFRTPLQLSKHTPESGILSRPHLALWVVVINWPGWGGIWSIITYNNINHFLGFRLSTSMIFYYNARLIASPAGQLNELLFWVASQIMSRSHHLKGPLKSSRSGPHIGIASAACPASPAPHCSSSPPVLFASFTALLRGLPLSLGPPCFPSRSVRSCPSTRWWQPH